MKNFLIALFFSLFVIPTYASCIGGTPFTGKNNVTYCVSNFQMNWWAAHMWCQSNNMKLATPSELCDYDVHPWNGDKGCWNIEGKVSLNHYGWLNLARPGNTPLVYVLIGTRYYGQSIRSDTSCLAICAPQ